MNTDWKEIKEELRVSVLGSVWGSVEYSVEYSAEYSICLLIKHSLNYAVWRVSIED